MEDNKEDLKNNTAEENKEAGKVDTQTTQNKDEVKAFKTFQTEEEYQEAVNSILKKKLPSKEEMKAFKKWQEDQKTDAQKQAERETEYQKVNEKNEKLENENKVLRAGVKTKYVDFVAYSVGKQDGDFDKNLKQYLKDNPEYIENAEVKVVKKVGTSLNLGGKGNTDQNETNQIMNNLIRSARD